MRVLRRFLGLGAILGLGLIAPAALAALAEQSSPKPARSVNCVYDAVSPEARTVVGELFEAVFARGEYPLKNRDVRDAIDAQIAAAANTCIDLYPLSAGETEIAGRFAVNSLMADFIAKLIRHYDGDPAQVTLYFQTRVARLPLLHVPTAAELAAIRAGMPSEWPAQAKNSMARAAFQYQARHPTKQETALLVADLKAKGWKFDAPPLASLAEFYLALQMQLAVYRRAYAER